jgi:hypothetical protein
LTGGRDTSVDQSIACHWPDSCAPAEISAPTSSRFVGGRARATGHRCLPDASACSLPLRCARGRRKPGRAIAAALAAP